MKSAVVAACLTLTLAACASTPHTSPTPLRATETTTLPCVPSKDLSWPSPCQNGSLYTQQRWQQLGATNTADALRQVSPFVNIR